MDDKRLAGIFDEILHVDKEAHFNSTPYDIDYYCQ